MGAPRLTGGVRARIAVAGRALFFCKNMYFFDDGGDEDDFWRGSVLAAHPRGAAQPSPPRRAAAAELPIATSLRRGATAGRGEPRTGPAPAHPRALRGGAARGGGAKRRAQFHGVTQAARFWGSCKK